MASPTSARNSASASRPCTPGATSTAASTPTRPNASANPRPRTTAPNPPSPTWPWSSRCSRRSPKKSGEPHAASPGRPTTAASLRGLAASRLPCSGPAAFDPKTEDEDPGGRKAVGEANAGVGGATPTLRLPADLGVAASRGLAGQSQADLAVVASRGAESPQQTAEEASASQQCQQLCASAGGAQEPRLGVGLLARPDQRWSFAEVVHGGGRVHARVPGVGGASQDSG